MSGRHFNSKRIKLSELTDEEIEEMMNSVEFDSEDDDFDSDDDYYDPNYELDQITPEISSEHDQEATDPRTTFSDGDFIGAGKFHIHIDLNSHTHHLFISHFRYRSHCKGFK